MRLHQQRGRLIVRDLPALAWAGHAIFIVGGLLVIALTWAGSSDPSVYSLGLALGLTNILGGLYLMARHPASIVELNPDCGEVRVRRWSPGWKRSHWYSLAALAGVEVEYSERSGGAKRYRPSLRFGGSELVPVSQSWCRGRDACDVVAQRINGYLEGLGRGATWPPH